MVRHAVIDRQGNIVLEIVASVVKLIDSRDVFGQSPSLGLFPGLEHLQPDGLGLVVRGALRAKSGIGGDEGNRKKEDNQLPGLHHALYDIGKSRDNDIEQSPFPAAASRNPASSRSIQKCRLKH